jgi:hypothetical protein
VKNSKPIKIIEIEHSSGDDSLEGKSPSKRRKSNLAIALKQKQQMVKVKVKEEAIQRAAAAETSVEAACRGKDAAVEASLQECQRAESTNYVGKTGGNSTCSSSRCHCRDGSAREGCCIGLAQSCTRRFGRHQQGGRSTNFENRRLLARSL